jgi:hypothetical protein
LWFTQLLKSRERNRALRSSLAILIVALFTLLMATPVSAPLWRVIPKLSSMEFPWRWLAAASILLSGLAGVSLPWLWQQLQQANEANRARSRQRFLLAAGAVVIVIVFSGAYPIRNGLFLGRDSFTELQQNVRTSPGLEEWLPRWTTFEAANRLAITEAPPVSVSGRTVSILRWDSELRQFTIGEGDKAFAQIHTFFYPDWELRTSEGRVLSIAPDADGVMLADVPSGRQTIQMKFGRPSHQFVGNSLSLAGIAALAVMTVLTLRRRAISIAA